MKTRRILLLGCPIDRLSPADLEPIFHDLISGYHKDFRVRFATTVNTLWLGQLSSLNLNHRVSQEVIECLRQADLVGLDSPFLQEASKCLGNGILHLIRSETLISHCAAYLNSYNRSLYLLGGKEEQTLQMAQALEEDFPGLALKGTISPSIFTKTSRLASSIDEDEEIVEAVNRAKPDVLFLELGHPKQEIWFLRVKERLKVPLCIGVGGGFERYLRARKSEPAPAPFSMDSRKLWRRVISGFHYSVWLPPLFIYQTLSRALASLFSRWESEKEAACQLFLSEREIVSTLRLPPILSYQTLPSLQPLAESVEEQDNLVIDASSLRFFDLAGLGWLFALWLEAKQKHKNLFILNLSSDLVWSLKLNGAWDLFAPCLVRSPTEILDRMSINLGFSLTEEREFLSLSYHDACTTLSLFGRLHGKEPHHNNLRQLASILEGKRCEVDLTYCTSITNQGFSFLIKLKQWQKEQNQPLTLRGVSSFLRKQFKLARLSSDFIFK